MVKKAKQYIHFSFDDVYACIKDITDHAGQYQSIFENELFGWLKRMHDQYGAVFSLYTFNYYSGNTEYDISFLPDCYATELVENAHWLKFGFHAKDELTKYIKDEPFGIKEDYDKFCATILHATYGHIDSIDRIVRLGWFAGSKRNILSLSSTKLGIKGLLSADDERIPYYFDEDTTKMIQSEGELWLDDLLILRSQRRIEGVRSIESLIEKMCSYTKPKVIELFSHEGCFELASKVESYTMSELYEYFIKWAYENGYGFDFAQNLYNEIGDLSY